MIEKVWLEAYEKLIASGDFNEDQKGEIYNGFEIGLRFYLIEFYAKDSLDWDKMYQIKLGFKNMPTLNLPPNK